MKLFGQVVRTAVNVVRLPIDAGLDLAGYVSPEDIDRGRVILPNTQRAVDRLVREADEDPAKENAR